MKKFLLCWALGGCIALPMNAQNFDDYFIDKTLRLDYIFTGDAHHQDICLDEICSLPQWAGRRHHLSELPLEGNGNVTVTDKATGKVIYRTSFSSLFQEWISEAEAFHTRRGFENSFLIPYPKQPVTVTVELQDKFRKTSASMSHEVRPDDILIHKKGTSRITPHRYLLQRGTVEN